MQTLETAVINVNQYTLAGSSDDFAATISALAERTLSVGHKGVETYRWYVNADAGTAGALIVYADAAAWLAHHHMAYQWPEMAALQATVSLTQLTVFGQLSPEVDELLANAGLDFAHYPTWTAGFQRPTG